MEEVEELSSIDWERVHVIICYSENNRFRFKVCYSEQEIEQHKIDLLFNDSIDPSSIRIRGPVPK